MNTTTKYPPRHIQGFRPLVPGEQWHRTDFTPDMLLDGWRPLLDGETWNADDQVKFEHGNWQNVAHWFVQTDGGVGQGHCRTRRPLPPPPPTFEHDGKTWNSHVPGDPCPVGDNQEVWALVVDAPQTKPRQARLYFWGMATSYPIIGYRIPDAEPQDDTAKLRERITELEFLLEDERKKYLGRSQHIEDLEHDLRTALSPRPIAEAGEVKDGFVRLYGQLTKNHPFMSHKVNFDTHFIDIKLPDPDPRAEYERAVAEAGGAFEAWLKAKGGAE